MWVDKTIYDQNGLQIIFSSYDWCAYSIKTSLYSIVVCERYGEDDIWDISIMDKSSPQKTLFKLCTFKMLDFMKPFHGHHIRKLTSAEEVDRLINKLLSMKVFL